MGWGKELMKAVKWAMIAATLLVQNCIQLGFFLSALLIHKPYLNSMHQNSLVCHALLGVKASLTSFFLFPPLRDLLMYQKNTWNTCEAYFPAENRARGTWKWKANRYCKCGKRTAAPWEQMLGRLHSSCYGAPEPYILFVFCWQSSGCKVLLWNGTDFLCCRAWSTALSAALVLKQNPSSIKEWARPCQNSSKHCFTFAFQHCSLTTRADCVWASSLNLSVICWAHTSPWGGGEMSLAHSGSSFEPIMNGLLFASILARSSLLLGVSLTLLPGRAPPQHSALTSDKSCVGPGLAMLFWMKDTFWDHLDCNIQRVNVF